MARHRDEDDAELDDWEDPDEADQDDEDDEDGVDTEPCPFCGKPVYEQAQVCPHCRNYISLEDKDAARPRKPRWIVWTVFALLIAGAIALSKWGRLW